MKDENGPHVWKFISHSRADLQVNIDEIRFIPVPANLWHAYPKWRAEKFPLHSALTACLNFFLFLLTDQHLYSYIVKNMCLYARSWLRSDSMNYRCYQIILRVKHFYTNRERCKELTGYFSLRRRPGDDWTNTWRWTNRFKSSFKQEIIAAPATATFCSL
jgi:hypothetical protein